MISRRKLLASMGTAVTVSIAGCSGNSTRSDNEGNSTRSDNEGNSTRSDNEGEDAREVFNQWIDARFGGDEETVNELTHPQSNRYPYEDVPDTSNHSSFSIIDVQEASFNDVRYSGSEEELKQTIREEKGIKFEELEYFKQIQEDAGKTQEWVHMVVREDGEWLVIPSALAASDTDSTS